MIGCVGGDLIYSIVLTGPKRSEIWMCSQDTGSIFGPSGIVYENDGSISDRSEDVPIPEQKSFLDWHEFWLDAALQNIQKGS